MTDMNDPFDTPRDTDRRARRAARAKGIGRTTLDALTRNGEIPCVRLAGRVLFPTAALHRIANGEGGAN